MVIHPSCVSSLILLRHVSNAFRKLLLLFQMKSASHKSVRPILCLHGDTANIEIITGYYKDHGHGDLVIEVPPQLLSGQSLWKKNLFITAYKSKNIFHLYLDLVLQRSTSEIIKNPPISIERKLFKIRVRVTYDELI